MAWYALAWAHPSGKGDAPPLADKEMLGWYVLYPARFTGVAVSVNRSRLRTIPIYLSSSLQEVSKPTGVCSSDEQRERKEISEEKLKKKKKKDKTENEEDEAPKREREQAKR
ncbi:hypothetical protein LZ31DRAFT_46849 [Colletotrichum somersetense]|nr:hypothetical protein LZ31DRAFT_46849 [Colletotrichum somersetense]